MISRKQTNAIKVCKLQSGFYLDFLLAFMKTATLLTLLALALAVSVFNFQIH